MNRRNVLYGLAALPVSARSHAGPVGVAIDETVDRWAANNAFAGVVLLGRSGKSRFARSFGLGSIEANERATVETRYAIGSVSKWFTTAAVLRLVDQGRLNLDAPIANYLPLLPSEIGSQVLLRHLLSNTSGIPDRLSEAAKTDSSVRASTASAIEMTARFVTGSIAFTPGTRFDYTVLNWVMVRAILEKLVGMDFPALMQHLVFEPAGLRGVGIAEQGFGAIPSLALAYLSVNPPVRKVDPVPAFAAASGTFYANANDLLLAAHQVFGSRFLSPKARRTMLTVQVPDEDYALGGRVHTMMGRIWAWETGKIGGYRTHLAHDVRMDRTIVVMGNTDMSQSTIASFVVQLADFA